MKPAASDPTRRTFLVAAGALVVTFSLAPRRVFGEDAAEGARSGPRLSASLTKTPWLDAWIRIDGDGRITVFTGKAELGQGIKTALLQVAADELEVAPTVIEMVTADTGRTPDEGVTAGSHSMQDSGTAIRQAAAQVRQLLLESAGKRWGIAPDLVTTTGTGSLRAPDGREAAYGELAAELSLHVEAKPEAPLRTAKRRVIGQNLPRLDIPAKLTGGAAYVQDMRLPGMLHARVVRGPSFGTRLEPIDAGSLSGLLGFVSLVRKGNFTAIVAENEWSAIVGMRQLQAAGWHRTAAPLPTAPTDAILQSLEFEDVAVEKVAGTAGAPVRSLKARYSRP
jgi:CO/xanthine dehydrogenase Mo-binding subunit